MPCEHLLLITSSRGPLDEVSDSLHAHGVTVLRVQRHEAALLVLRASFNPDAILVDLTPGAPAYRDFLRLLFEEPDWRRIPVLGVSGSGGLWFQLAPRHLARKLPAPGDPEQARALLDAIASYVHPGYARGRGGAWEHAYE